MSVLSLVVWVHFRLSHQKADQIEATGRARGHQRRLGEEIFLKKGRLITLFNRFHLPCSIFRCPQRPTIAWPRPSGPYSKRNGEPYPRRDWF
jgi:hypothetical protein